MFNFEGRTLFMTGADGAIGRAVAGLFHSFGANLCLSDLAGSGLAAFADGLQGGKGEVEVVAANVSAPAEIEAAIAACRRRFGGIDFLVPMAGRYPEGLLATVSYADWLALVDINLNGVFLSCRHAIPLLRDGSAIVLIASIAAHRGSLAHAPYAATKGALLSLSRSLALELAPRTRVNAVSPGVIASPMTDTLVAASGGELVARTPLKRLGEPGEVASVIAFLCSNAASFVTGETVHVNGGLYISG